MNRAGLLAAAGWAAMPVASAVAQTGGDANLSAAPPAQPSGAGMWAVLSALVLLACVIAANMWSSKRGHRD